MVPLTRLGVPVFLSVRSSVTGLPTAGGDERLGTQQFSFAIFLDDAVRKAGDDGAGGLGFRRPLLRSEAGWSRPANAPCEFR